MSELSLQQILSSRFRTSSTADKHTLQLLEALGLSTKANIARLAIGRSLGAGKLPPDVVDAKGLEIPATSLFTQADVAAWVGLIITHAKIYKADDINSMESFRIAIRSHWHRGAQLLIDDWEACEHNYDQFLSILMNRRADLPITAAHQKSQASSGNNPQKAQDFSLQLSKALTDIGVNAEIRNFVHGPRISRYKIFLNDINQVDKLRRGLERISLILGLQNSLPLLSPGDEGKTIFIDIPRSKDSWIVPKFSELRAWLETLPSDDDQLTVFPGVDVMGKPFSFDLLKAPHLLVGGATGQGKSVCLHALILSLILKHSSQDLQLALIDPKQVEFSIYKNSNFLYGGDISVDIHEIRETVQNLIAEMDERYTLFRENNVTNISEARVIGIKSPYVVIFIEELADLILQDRTLENSIVRLAQLGRAAGLHLVLATQRPDAKTFSGLIRSNIPARIALTVQKSTESSIILDDTGAESLLGEGDMLVKTTGSQIMRVHGTYISRKDIESALRG